MPRTNAGDTPSSFAFLPSPTQAEHRWTSTPSDRPPDGFLVDFHNARSKDAPRHLHTLGWQTAQDASGRWMASRASISLMLTQEGAGYRVIGTGPSWMPDNAVVFPFDFLVHGEHGGNRQKALDALCEQYLRELKDEARRLAMDYPDTDAGNMERLVARWWRDCRYSDALGWHVWDGTVWRRQDGKDSVLLLARMRETIRFAAWGVADDDKELDAKRKHLQRSENTAKLKAAVDQARSHGGLTAKDGEFDQKPWLVGFKNGVWKDGLFTAGHAREHRMTRLMPVEYSPAPSKTEDAEWMALLERMVCGDQSKALMLQEVAGAAIGGGANNRILPWLFGPGGTGKTTFLDLLMASMGESAQSLGQEMVSGQQDSEKLGVAVLGRRLLVLQEMGGERVSTSLAKRLTGGDPLPARFLYSSSYFTVKPTWLVIAASNDEPVADAGDATFWNTRMKVIGLENPLDRGRKDFLRFTSSRGAPSAALSEVRRDPESPLVRGFVRWAMLGAERLHAEGREIAWTPEVRKKTEEMRRDNDPLTEFIQYLKEQHKRDIVGAGMDQSRIGLLYRDWCRDNEIKHRLGTRKLYRHLEASGFRKGQRTVNGDRWVLPGDEWVLPGDEMPTPSSDVSVPERESPRTFNPDWAFDQPPGFSGDDGGLLGGSE